MNPTLFMFLGPDNLPKPKKVEFQHEELRNPKWRHSARQGQVLFYVYTEPRYPQILMLFFQSPKQIRLISREIAPMTK